MAKIFYIILTIIVIATGCLDPFEFEQVDSDDAIVVDAQFTTSDGPHYFRISNVLAFGSKFFDPVPGASVRLHHNEDIIPYEEVSPGVHMIAKGVIAGIPGEVYSMSMTLPNGDIFTSVPDVMPKAYELQEVNAVFKRESIVDAFGTARRERVIEVSINARFPELSVEDPFYLRYSIEEDYSYPEQSCGGLHQPKTCYINEPAFSKDFALFDSRLSSKNTIDSLLLLKKSGLRGVLFRGKHYFSVSQHSITERAYQYWVQVNEVTNQQGTVFDKPPASVQGNVIASEGSAMKVLGYFELASIDVQRDFILPSEYFEGSIDNDECSVFSRGRWPSRCCQCLQIEDASLSRPTWF